MVSFLKLKKLSVAKTKKQILVIHGGDFFETRAEYVASLKREVLSKDDLFRDTGKRWRDNLQNDLGSTYEVFNPGMPSPDDAKYSDWKIRFDKILLFLKDEVIMVGHSLGGIFLARYLSENVLPVKIRAVFLVAAPYFKADKKKGMSVNAGFSLNGNFKKLESQTDIVYILHSKDDPVVDAKHAYMYTSAIPEAELVMLDTLGHFRQEHFTELIAIIKKC